MKQESPLDNLLAAAKTRVNQRLALAISKQESSFSDTHAATASLERLQQACLYSIENGGKRLRPALFYACCEALNSKASAADLDLIAAAIECIHSYSLVHDDLPAMDNDVLRRGKATCHIAFDEPTAILVGDGLQALAFELLSQCQQLSAAQIVALVRELAQAAGNLGMVGGQMIDLAATGQSLSLPQLEQMHRLKTGAIIRVCARMAAICSDATAEQQQALDNYSSKLGLGFQVHDDILDIESDTQTLGKTQGADIKLNKQTYPALLGLEAAKALRQHLIASAKQALVDANIVSSNLDQLADYIIQRNH